MAVRTYYGTCTTASGESEKKVYVPDLDLTAGNNGFNFQEGDLLVVFFAQTNTVSEPSVVVYIQDPEVETSTTSDIGKYIKSLDVQADMENAWAAGETVIFAYTQQSTSETYYWELINANHASIETYGDTKLFDDSHLSSWLITPEAIEDSKIALTPNALKKFFNLLNSDTDEEEEEGISLGLKWKPVPGTPETLGTLFLGDDTDPTKGVNITYPIDERIAQYLGNNWPLEYTGQLKNNGNGTPVDPEQEGTGPMDPDAEPFITRIIPENLYFGNGQGLYYGTPSLDPAQPRIILNDDNDKIVVGNSGLGIVLDKPTDINGNLKVGGLLTVRTDTDEQPSPVSDVFIKTNGMITEQNVQLNQRYGPLYKVKQWTDRNIPKINKNRSASRDGEPHLLLNVNETGWRAIGVVGYNISWDQAKNSGGEAGDQAFALLWENHCVRKNNIDYVNFAIRNLRDDDIKVIISFWVLYTKEGIS